MTFNGLGHPFHEEDPVAVRNITLSSTTMLRGVVTCWLCLAGVSSPILASAVANSTGSLTLEILEPASLPAGFVLNPGGTIPSSFDFPDATNGGNGAFIANGTANCTPTGCTSPEPGTDIQYELTNDLTCSAQPDGTYGGLEDSFALFAADNATGNNVSLSLRFTSSWSLSAAIEAPLVTDSAEATIDLLWAVPTDFCIELTDCPNGSLAGGSQGNCPSSFVSSAVLVLGTHAIAVEEGETTAMAPLSACDANLIVLAQAGSGGDVSVTSSCRAVSNSDLFFDGFESGDASAWSASTGNPALLQPTFGAE